MYNKKLKRSKGDLETVFRMALKKEKSCKKIQSVPMGYKFIQKIG